ncbi:hypothetical protein C8R47DRAFT_1214286 [Mycena vitilis]|nr:hypothetical protein C8R47DRAFT_1214286 [Mycena vitilis]
MQSSADKLRDKFDAMDKLMEEWPFETLGDFLLILFHNPARSESDPRTDRHARTVAQFLRGRTDVKMSDIFPLIYKHRTSYPSSGTVNEHEQELMFSTTGNPDEIHHARPFLSTWAARTVTAEARREVGRATRDDPQDPKDHTRLPTRTLSWQQLLSHFNLKWIHTQYCIRLPLAIFLTEAMAAPKAKGAFFVRKRRPHPIIQVGVIASFIISRNRYANGTLAMVLGVWQFACKSHIDLKRVY